MPRRWDACLHVKGERKISSLYPLPLPPQMPRSLHFVECEIARVAEVEQHFKAKSENGGRCTPILDIYIS